MLGRSDLPINGIACDGCGFINANKVDLVTGTANFSGDDLTGFSISSTAILTVSGDGFISDAVADELNLMSGGYSQSGAIDIEGNLNIQVSGEVDVNLSSAASIKANNLFFSAYTIYNQADITIADSATFDVRNKFLNGFYYQGVDQRNGGNIRADNFNVIAVGNFSNQHYATINANDFNVVAGGDFTNMFSNISANNFNVVAGGDFSNSDTELELRLSTISANNFNVVAGGSFYNQIFAIIKANDFSVTVDNYFNAHNLGDGDITADTFNLSVAGDFDYASDYLNIGNKIIC